MTKICRTNCSYDLAKTTRLATPLSTKSCLVKYEPFVERSPILKTACILQSTFVMGLIILLALYFIGKDEISFLTTHERLN